MIKTVFLVPEHDNSGKGFPLEIYVVLEQRLVQEFGGYTRQSGMVGAWSQGSTVYRDQSRQYTVSLSRWTEVPSWLEMIRWVCRTFRQEAIYVEVAGIPEIIGPD